jgi:hypothetical protein
VPAEYIAGEREHADVADLTDAEITPEYCLKCVDGDEVPAETPDIKAHLAYHGFTLVGMGGNLTAYSRQDDPTDPEVIEYIYSAEAEGFAPERRDEGIEVCLENTTDEERRIEVATSGFTLADALAALDNPSEEYHLLNLRLDNGLHKAGV